MNVGFIAHGSGLYGANRSLLGLIDGLKPYGVASFVVTPMEGDINNALHDRGVPCETIPIRWWMSKPFPGGSPLRRIRRARRRRVKAVKRLRANLRVLPALVRQMRQWEVEVVHTNSSVIPTGALAAWKLNAPHVWHLREFGDLDYGWAPDWGRTVFRLLLGSADALIAVSDSVRRHVAKGVRCKNVSTVYNGIAWGRDFDRFRTLGEGISGSEQPYTFTLVGRVHPAKGQETAIRALASVVSCFPTTRLHIVGDGDTQPLKRLTHQLDLAGNVEFVGYVEDPYPAYFRANAVLVCSRHEAMGRVTAEAMSACRPVIGFDSAGTAELVEDEHTGLLYSGDHEMLAESMMRCIRYPDYARQLGLNGWHVARRRFTVEMYAERVHSVLSTVLLAQSLT
ncbi:glycosyltransferase family 4 protein [Chloroflexota bacterium]